MRADTAVETAILREAIKKEDKHIHLRQDFRVKDPTKSAHACEATAPRRGRQGCGLTRHCSGHSRCFSEADADTAAAAQYVTERVLVNSSQL